MIKYIHVNKEMKMSRIRYLDTYWELGYFEGLGNTV